MNIIGFLDILGYKQLLDTKYKNDENKFLNIVDNVINEAFVAVNKLSNHSTVSGLPKIKINTFSDNIVLSLEINKDFTSYDLINYFQIVCEISRIFIIKYNIFLRGGIELGNYYRDERFAFGTGLVKAYTAEGKAIYPRITVSAEVILLLNEKYIKNYLTIESNNFFNNIRNLFDLIKQNTTLSSTNKKTYENIKKSLDEIIQNLISRLLFSHYNVLDEHAAKFIVTIKNYQFLIDSLANHFDDSNLIKTLNSSYKDIELAFKTYYQIQLNSIESYKQKYLIFEQSNSIYLNYLSYGISTLFYVKYSKNFPVFYKQSNGSFISSVGRIDKHKVIFCETCDNFLIHKEQNIKEIKKHKEVIIDNINTYSNNSHLLEKYTWSKIYHNLFCKEILNNKFISKKEYTSLIID